MLSRIAEKLRGSSATNHGRHTQELDSNKVSKEVDELRKKLAQRRQAIEADKGVTDAKAQVVACLRLNDRRPLDCWEEVERFKSEVGRLEKRFVDSNGG